MSDYLEPVVVELEGRDRKLLDTLTRAKAEVRRFVTDVARMNATIKVDVKLRDGEIQRVQERIGRINATVRVGLRLDQTDRDRLDAQLAGKQFTASINPALDEEAERRVEASLAHLARTRIASIVADADTRAAADDLDLLTRVRRARIVADADTRTAADDLALLTRPRVITIHTHITGNTNLPNGPGAGPNGGRGREGGGGGGAMGALLTLAPALMPIAAEATAVAAAVGAATVAVGAFGAAVKPQLSDLSNAADAQKKLTDAVAKYGAGSKQAATAQQELSQTLAAMPSATRQAAGAFLNLKSDFTAWSNSLAKFTMVPVTQGIGVLDALLPRLSPLVKDVSSQFTRLTTLLGAGVNSGAFDGLMSRFTAFANGALRTAVDGIVHFSRVLAQGGGNTAFNQFMTYAKQNAPLVKDTLKSVAEAVLNIMKAASQAGPGMLTLVNALAKLVAALPPSVIAGLLQVSAAIKAIGLARSGIDAVSGPMGTLRTRLTELLAVSRAAGGGLAGLRAAFNSLSTGAKIGVAVGGITALIAVMHELSDNKGPVAVDQLSASLNTLASTGRVTGVLKTNLKDISESIAMVSKGASDNKLVQLTSDFGSFIGMSTGPGVSTARKNVDAWDKSMAQLVQSGHPKEAAAQYDILKRSWVAGGGDLKRLGKFTNDYQSALADQKFEAKMAADAQGLFGQQAQRTQQALASQKASADGLRQSIQALNDVNRAGLGGMIAFNQSLADTAAAAKKNAGALSMSHGQLNLNKQTARDAASALQDLADKTDSAAGAARDSGASWQTVNGIYSQGRAALIKNAEAMGLSASQARTLASQILKIPDKTARVKMNVEDATRDLTAFNARVRSSPGSKSVTLKTLSASAEQVLTAFGYKVTHLKNGQVKVTAVTGAALSAIRNVQGAINSLHNKTIGIGIYKTTYLNTVHKGASVPGVTPYARGGRVRGYADGGDVQAYPDGGYIQGPGSSTSDSIVTLLRSGNVVRTSNTEFVVNARETAKHRRLLEMINAGQLPKFAKGGLTPAEKNARGQLSGAFGISGFGRMAGYQHTGFERDLAIPSDINALVSSLNQFRAEIKAAFRGKTESSLLRQLEKSGRSLINYDKQLTKVTSSLASAKTKLDDLKNSAAQLKASVASSIMQNVSVVTQAPQAGFGLTSQDVVNSMSAQLSQTLTFSNQLQALKKRGLSADLLEQISSAGVDQGGATAAALAGASDAQLKQLNSMQTQLKKSANAAGSAVSDAMYGAGIRAADGLVKGLEKRQKAIEDQMMKIAKSMEKAIKHELGIKSPSTKLAKVGDDSALGLAHGIRRSSKHAVIAAQGMAMSVAHGASLAGSPTWSGVPTSGGRGGVVNHYHYEFHVEGSVATVDKLAKDVEVAFLRRGMRNPMTYQPYVR